MSQPSRRSKEQKTPRQYIVPGGTVLEGGIRPEETAEERKHRLKKDVWSFWVKEALAYIVALFILGITAVYCFWVLFHPASSKEERQWVLSTLTSLLVGVIGYVFGKVTK
jgi:hypothetical protein